MAYTDADLNKINIFPSTAIYNNNLSSLATSDLNLIKQNAADLALECGGIVAQSIGTNGYIKFANGIIIQWGLSSNSTTEYASTSTFPITFNIIFSVSSAIVEGSNSGNNYDDSVRISTTTIKFRYYAHYWIAIGK